MAFDEKHIELIELHLADALTAQQKLEFDRLMQRADFRQQVDFHVNLRVAATAEGRDDLRGNMKQWESNPPDRFNIKNWSLFRVAALLLLLIGSIILLRQFLQDNQRDLFADFYQPFPNLIDPIARDQPGDILTISQHFERGNYVSALELQPADSLQLFYQALALLAVDRTEESIAGLAQIAGDEGHLFYGEAQWYLALAYLKENQQGPCKELLETIASVPSHDFAAKAEQLLIQLSR